MSVARPERLRQRACSGWHPQSLQAESARKKAAARTGASCMYGLIAKLTAAQGKREELIGLLKSSGAKMPGCYSYVVAKDSMDEDVLWVTEVWESAASHDASLSLPAVREAIPQAKLIVSHFEKIAATMPVWDGGRVEDAR